jgi:GTP-binding protein
MSPVVTLANVGMSPKDVERAFRQEAQHVFAASPGGAFPPESLPEVAFAGRSNVGKSSLINALLGRKKLARISGTPGATRAVHFYDIGHRFCLVDLPGYGYAKLSKEESARIAGWVEAYLSSRRSLRLVCLLIDSRHGLKDHDRALLHHLAELGLEVQLVLTKADKLHPTQQKAILEQMDGEMQRMPAIAGVSLTASDTQLGIDTLQMRIMSAVVAA